MNAPYIAQYRITIHIAARYGMTYEYKTARHNGLDSLEALEDWDILTKEDWLRIEKVYYDSRNSWII